MALFEFTELDKIKYSGYFMLTYIARIHTIPTAIRASANTILPCTGEYFKRLTCINSYDCHSNSFLSSSYFKFEEIET